MHGYAVGDQFVEFKVHANWSLRMTTNDNRVNTKGLCGTKEKECELPFYLFA
jgi:hypothetical protein